MSWNLASTSAARNRAACGKRRMSRDKRHLPAEHASSGDASRFSAQHPLVESAGIQHVEEKSAASRHRLEPPLGTHQAHCAGKEAR